MRPRSIPRLILVCALVGALTAVAAPGSAGTSTGEPSSVGHALPVAVVTSVLSASGVTVRHGSGVRVDRVSVPEELRRDGVPSFAYRVRIQGTYVPRALRYVVSAGGRPVAFGSPSPRLTSLLAVTTDPAVVTESIGVSYGGAPAEGDTVDLASSRANPARVRTGGRMARGPLDVTKRVYDLGDQVYQPPGLRAKVELIADVHYPKGLPGGPYPLVLFLHGNHSACYRGHSSGYTWPCRDGWEAIPNYEGYDYIAERLASYGYVVVSVSGNGVNVLGSRLNDTGMRQRGEVLERHLELWRDWSTTGGDPFGTRFVGKVDMSRIGTMGHSRGGEGAVWQVIVDRERPDPFGIDAILPLAPVDFTRATVNDVPMAVMLPYCDGDVYDLQGVHFFDDARYRVPGDDTPKHTVTVFGANHNFFNTVWTPSSGYPGSFDDGTRRCDGRLRPIQERRVGAAYIVSFFRRYVGGDLGQIRSGPAHAPRRASPPRTSSPASSPRTRRRSDSMSIGSPTRARCRTGPWVVPWSLVRWRTSDGAPTPTRCLASLATSSTKTSTSRVWAVGSSAGRIRMPPCGSGSRTAPATCSGSTPSRCERRWIRGIRSTTGTSRTSAWPWWTAAVGSPRSPRRRWATVRSPILRASGDTRGTSSCSSSGSRSRPSTASTSVTSGRSSSGSTARRPA